MHILLKLVDFLTVTAANRSRETQPGDKGWYKIAWAFLKVSGFTVLENGATPTVLVKMRWNAPLCAAKTRDVPNANSFNGQEAANVCPEWLPFLYSMLVLERATGPPVPKQPTLKGGRWGRGEEGRFEIPFQLAWPDCSCADVRSPRFGSPIEANTKS